MENNEIKDQTSLDLIDVAKNIAKEKGISAEEVLEAMEAAIAKAGRTKYGYELDIRAQVDKKSGKIGLFRYQEVVEDPEILPMEERTNKIALSQLPSKNKLKLGEFLVEELPPLDFGRIAVQTAKQVIFQKVKEAERIMQFNEFKDKTDNFEITLTLYDEEGYELTSTVQGSVTAEADAPSFLFDLQDMTVYEDFED